MTTRTRYQNIVLVVLAIRLAIMAFKTLSEQAKAKA